MPKFTKKPINKIIEIRENQLPEIVSKIQPLFNYNLVAYQLSESQARFAYPKYKDGGVNWNADEKAQIPELNIDLPFEDLIGQKDGIFEIITLSRLNNIRVYKSKLLQASLKSDIHFIPEKSTLYNRKDFGDESLAGLKVHIDYYNNTVYSLVDSYSISAYKTN